MKCLEKDRARRYETANGLAADLLHYLADEPVQAGPPSAADRLRKYARKYKAALTVAAAFVLLLAAAAGVSTWLAVKATIAEGKAREAEGTAKTERDAARTANENLLRSRDELERALARSLVVIGQIFNSCLMPPMLTCETGRQRS
jgi:hypothetical protein